MMPARIAVARAAAYAAGPLWIGCGLTASALHRAPMDDSNREVQLADITADDLPIYTGQLIYHLPLLLGNISRVGFLILCHCNCTN